MAIPYAPSAELLRYINSSWASLRRSPLDPAPDPKIIDGSVSFLYIPACEDIHTIRELVNDRRDKLCSQNQSYVSSLPVIVKYVPEDSATLSDHEHGLLFVPNDYVVPGGRFNEMYGWDSYWIVKGLVCSGETKLAQGMVENFLYQIENYGGKILNANRTYYISRSNPPLLGEMIDAVVNQMQPQSRVEFLEKTVPVLEMECLFWKNERYSIEEGLFHYGHPDMGELGLCPEVRMGEVDTETGLSHYDKIIFSLKERATDDIYRQRFYSPATNSLTKAAIASDRGVRESGFDPSMYMGYYGLETLDIRPVCLNTLLCMQFHKLASFYQEQGNVAKSQHWRSESVQLAQKIRTQMWNDQHGLFYGVNAHTGKQNEFKFLTTFYPLVAGIATPEQARRVRDNLPLFEREFGLTTTPEKTGCQWDAPNMWAPLVYFTIRGLLKYGYEEDAQRISDKYLKTVDNAYLTTGAIYEKYDAATGSNETSGVTVGYRENVVGFGWTNGVALALIDMTKRNLTNTLQR